jgi:hypothetical protein
MPWLVTFIVVLPLLGAYAAGTALEHFWLTPSCVERCATRGGATLVAVIPGHKSGEPQAGCLCSDRETVPWSGPTIVGIGQIGAYLLSVVGCVGVSTLFAPEGGSRKRRGR